MKRALGLTALLSLLAFANAAPSAAAGKKVYDANCAACHGPKAQGGIGVNLKKSSAWKYDLFKRALKEGKNDKGVALKPLMPKFPQLSDEQMKSIQAHLKAVTK